VTDCAACVTWRHPRQLQVTATDVMLVSACYRTQHRDGGFQWNTWDRL
jgi:hypothetical protein